MPHQEERFKFYDVTPRDSGDPRKARAIEHLVNWMVDEGILPSPAEIATAITEDREIAQLMEDLTGRLVRYRGQEEDLKVAQTLRVIIPHGFNVDPYPGGGFRITSHAADDEEGGEAPSGLLPGDPEAAEAQEAVNWRRSELINRVGLAALKRRLLNG